MNAWMNAKEQTRSTVYLGLSLLVVFVLMLSVVGITSAANNQLRFDNLMLQATIDEQRISADRFDVDAQQLIESTDITVTLFKTESRSSARGDSWGGSWGN